MNIIRAPMHVVVVAAAMAFGSAVPLSAQAAETLRYATVGEPPSMEPPFYVSSKSD